MSDTRSVDVFFAVDSCHFVILHPRDHARMRDGSGFWLVEDSIEDILEQGLVLGMSLGADGYKALRVVFGALPEHSRADVLGDPFVFRLDARHGRLFVHDPSYAFPTREELATTNDEELAKEYAFFDVENGRYRASLHPLNGEAVEREKVVWILTLESVATFDGIAPWQDFPNEDSEHRSGVAPPAEKERIRVRHAKYGLGWAIDGEPGVASAVRVVFDDHGEKKIAGTFLTTAKA